MSPYPPPNNNLESCRNHAPFDQFYSVEFAMRYPKLLYQFKIWISSSKAMFILVKENSDLMAQLKKGEIFKTKYYTTDAQSPTVDLETQIKEITKDSDGRFKGHYRVGLDILTAQPQGLAH